MVGIVDNHRALRFPIPRHSTSRWSDVTSADWHHLLITVLLAIIRIRFAVVDACPWMYWWYVSTSIWPREHQRSPLCGKISYLLIDLPIESTCMIWRRHAIKPNAFHMEMPQDNALCQVAGQSAIVPMYLNCFSVQRVKVLKSYCSTLWFDGLAPFPTWMTIGYQRDYPKMSYPLACAYSDGRRKDLIYAQGGSQAMQHFTNFLGRDHKRPTGLASSCHIRVDVRLYL